LFGFEAIGVALALATVLPLAWKWQLGVRRVAAGVALLGIAASSLVAALDAAARLSRPVTVALAWALTLALAGVVLAYRFYRDPERRSPPLPDVVVSPADGEVVYVRTSSEGRLPVATKRGKHYELSELTRTPLRERDAVVIGIAMSFLDVHVNRSPIAGRVKIQGHFAGSFGSLRRPEMVFENERATTVIEGSGLEVAVVQIASRLVRQIAAFVQTGEEVAVGQRIGVIRLGSQVDLVLPASSHLRVTVSPGERVRAGESVVAIVEARQMPMRAQPLERPTAPPPARAT